jgi:hypothetical protein
MPLGIRTFDASDSADPRRKLRAVLPPPIRRRAHPHPCGPGTGLSGVPLRSIPCGNALAPSGLARPSNPLRGRALRRSLGRTPNSENQNARRFGSPCASPVRHIHPLNPPHFHRLVKRAHSPPYSIHRCAYGYRESPGENPLGLVSRIQRPY